MRGRRRERFDGVPLRPLTPIFSTEKMTGSVNVGSTPSTPTVESDLVLAYDTSLSAGTDIAFDLLDPNLLTIDWGDGSTEPATSTGTYSHTYASDGTYTVRISADSPTGTDLGGFNGHDTAVQAEKLVGVTAWGTLGITSLSLACWMADNVAAVAPPPGTATDLSFMFQGATGVSADLSSWDVSSVTNVAGMFSQSNFNGSITAWDTSSIVDFTSMFLQNAAFNQNIGGWDTSSATDMIGMFRNATAFNQDLSGWCVSLIPSKPALFDSGASSWVLPQPAWGTCP